MEINEILALLILFKQRMLYQVNKLGRFVFFIRFRTISDKEFLFL